MHFVPSWPAGGAIQARYTRGDMVLDYAANRRTVPDVAGVVASVWSEELTQAGIAYAYAGGELDADISRYCAAMRIRAGYRPFERGLLRNTERALELRLDGIDRLPRGYVTATFRRGTDSKTRSWDVLRWDRGESKVLEPGWALPWDPEEVKIEVSFPRTGYRYATRWPGP